MSCLQGTYTSEETTGDFRAVSKYKDRYSGVGGVNKREKGLSFYFVNLKLGITLRGMVIK